MTWLHTYTGLLLGWLIFAIWVTGTLSYFNLEISLWMKPELEYSQNRDGLIDHSLQLLHEKGQKSDRWRINLPSDRSSHWSIEWRDGRASETRTINPEDTSFVEPRDTEGGNFFRTFHYTLELRNYGGRFYAGVAAMMFLVALFSGIFTHRRFFRDFFTLRKEKQGTLLRDFHALAGVISIPFNIMICVSALFIYVIMYMPWSAEHYYEGGERAVYRDIIPSLPALDSDSTDAIPIEDFSVVLHQIRRRWPGDQQIARVTIEQPYQQNGRIIVDRVKHEALSSQAERLVFSSATGESLQGYPAQSTAMDIRRLLWGLHEGKFAPPILRWLFFFIGIISSALVATGLIYWLKIRLDQTEERHLGHYLVERLNIAGISGLILAIASYFLANRILPVELVERASLEVEVFLWTWLVCLLYAFIRPAKSAWREQLALAAIGYLSVLLIDLYQDTGRMLTAIEQGNMPYISFALALVVSAALLLFASVWLGKSPTASTKKATDTSPVSHEPDL